jgi:glycosyltransferase involved in cell wall biosynthesis
MKILLVHNSYRAPGGEDVVFQQEARLLEQHGHQGFPMVIAESFACGKPVLGSRLGSTEELIDDGRTGLHFTAGDAADLADKVQRAWHHPPQVAGMGREARREYETLYTSERNYGLLIGIYECLLRKAGRSTQPVFSRVARG